MFALRLARDMGRVDVDGLLEEMTPEQFREWQAAYLTGQLDDHWQQTSVICAVIMNIARGLSAALSGKRMKKTDYAQPEHFMPDVFGALRKRRKKKKSNLFAFEKYLQATYGNNRIPVGESASGREGSAQADRSGDAQA